MENKSFNGCHLFCPVDLGFGVVVVRDVSATVCSQCGADWIEDAIAGKVEEIVDEAHKKHHLVEVTTLLAN
ncbi:MAG: hypothetical protein A3G39_03395 [Deltaproteobacteria bacterium RIFCSPLOWO2_12_FULL_43_16]|nr:MAG: hypothetical protein A2Z89_07745 [Deltaproteobacteria bacterium GWA2_43_19]OGQ10691.1 MAG: hypothetical protein A3D30_03270 [Deltaproteobacteria bacterium RIFCSPHIGHO2_02_FULL_43_33]OGQ33466.1 MAG: hypothetical protein A3A85_00535 [Deltaproteobacteria bacterium RIFCSPLOWO2_01_FULL_42_9]OGQ60008.1 MAG: hypothetical protein A3G39_03395 [Deltaproteobacteria bacterium RIFCSPLOWO2_12_FULL_43_16]